MTSDAHDPVLISVVVPTCKRPHLLKRCLDALLAQTLDRFLYEIVVADDAGCEVTRKIVECLSGQTTGKGPRLSYFAVNERHGPAAARNVGWRAARGEFIAFTDDDCIPDSRWLQAGLEAFGEDEEILGVSGKVIIPLPPVPTDYEYNYNGLSQSQFVTASCFYRRRFLEKVGGFDEQFELPWREDSDLFFRLLKLGEGKVVRAPEALVVHPVPPGKWGVSLKQQRRNYYNALLYKKHPEYYRLYLSPVTPWRYYQIMLALLAGLLGFWRRQPLLALTGLSLWAFLTGRFSLLRLSKTSHEPGHVAEMLITSVLIPPLALFWRMAGAIKYKVFFL
ncbi:MAG TPA: glycosyltransferase [Chloroflexia bacterium]|nr:glycosyltransferase [Chloroflexia bacterium]